jgi:hypothetical protein
MTDYSKLIAETRAGQRYRARHCADLATRLIDALETACREHDEEARNLLTDLRKTLDVLESTARDLATLRSERDRYAQRAAAYREVLERVVGWNLDDLHADVKAALHE